MVTRPRLLDLYCCEGGAGMGYHLAGFDVVGVDIVARPRYPFEFHQGDALAYLEQHGHLFDAIHASPPCQDHSSLKSMAGDHGTAHLLPDTRAALIALRRPWIMENVPGAPMPNAVMLCGSMFGLGADCEDGYHQLRRHRLFEHHPDVPAWPPYTCQHVGQPMGVYGGGGGARSNGRYQARRDEAVAALGTPWMTKHGVTQAIPPAYTEHLGAALLAALVRA
jgi:DNA (cytosine-5)-methyltransferase 1